MTIDIGRREFILTLGGAALAWPRTAQAQQPAMPVIGFLSGRSPGEAASAVGAFRLGLGDLGISRAKTSRSNIVGLMDITIGSRRWRLTSCIFGSA